MNEVAKCSDEIMAEVIRRAEEGRIEMRNSIANLNQRINMLRERCRNQPFMRRPVADLSYKR